MTVMISISIMKTWRISTNDNKGYSVPELVVAMVILVMLSLAVMSAYTVLVGSAGLAKMKSAGLGLATEQLEYLRSLPYDYLAISGGTINSSGPKLPANKEATAGPYTFIITTSIQYADDAYDGCLNYPTAQSYLCRGGPPKTGTPIDANPRDYKLADVVVKEKRSGREVSRVSTQIAARVAETGGNTGALIVTITDSTGQPISGATARAVNNTLSPVFDQTAVADTNGVALFLDVTPDSGKDFVITVSNPGYNTLSTIAPSGSLVPTYPHVSVLAQQVTSSTLKIDQLAADSLQITVVDSSGAALPGSTFSIKGGTKLYTSAVDQTYSFTQNAVVTDGSGQYLFHNLVPGPYYVCFTNDLCSANNYLTVTQAALGGNSLQPVFVPAGQTSEAGSGPMQLAKLYVSSSSASPRIKTITPTDFSAGSANIGTAQFTVTGANLANATVSLRQGGVTLTTSKIDTDASASIKRQVNLSGQLGAWEVLVTNGSTTLVQTGLTPGALGGINVAP